MRTLVAGVLRSVVVVGLAVGALRTAVWLLDGNDPSSSADIGLGVVPLAVGAFVAAVWAFTDARGSAHAHVRSQWVTAAALSGAAAVAKGLLQSEPDVVGGVVVGVAASVVVLLPALAGRSLAQTGRWANAG